MGIYDTFKTNKQAEAEGVWKEFPKNKDGTVPAFLIRRMSKSNPEFQKRIEHYAKLYKTELSLDIMDEEQAHEPLLRVFCETVLVDWRNVQAEDGMRMDYTPELAYQLMEDLPDLYLLLREYATKISTFRDTEIENTAGN